MKSPRSSPLRGLETTAAIEPGGPAMRAGQKGRPVAATDSDGHGDAAQDSVARQGLPEELRPLFWDCDFDALQVQQ
ncbi:MAG: hypothetical protein ACC645_00995, partial [Pirellulales bacterium]